MTELAIGALFFLLASQLTAAGASSFTRLSERLSLLEQSYVLLVYPWITPLTAIITSAVLLRPSWLGGLIPTHCHANICGPHVPEIEYNGLGWLLLQTSAILFIVFSLLTLLFFLVSSLGKLEALRALSMQSKDYQVLDHPKHIAWCGGLLKQTIFISRGLHEKLDEHELQYVLWHEAIHKRRFDNLRKASLRLITLTWPRSISKPYNMLFSNRLEALCERLCRAEFDLANNAETTGTQSNDPTICVHNTLPMRDFNSDTMSSDSRGNLAINVAIVVAAAALAALQVTLLSSLGHFALEWIIPS
jgi:succinate dehydrogenase hydrophobic anchor subunit